VESISSTHIMLALVLFSAGALLAPGPGVLGMPAGNSSEAQDAGSWDYGSWFESLMDWDYADAANTVYEHLPQSVKNYFKESREKGEELFYKIYEDINEDVIGRVEKNLDQLHQLAESVIGGVSNIVDATISKLASGRPLSDEEKTALDSEFETLKGEFDNLEQKVAVEREAEAKLPDVYENQIQKFITAGREMLSSVGEGQEVLWDKTKQLQVEMYKIMDLLADSSEELKTKLKDLFKSIQEIDVTKIGETPRALN